MAGQPGVLGCKRVGYFHRRTGDEHLVLPGQLAYDFRASRHHLEIFKEAGGEDHGIDRAPVLFGNDVPQIARVQVRPAYLGPERLIVKSNVLTQRVGDRLVHVDGDSSQAACIL